MPPARHIPVLSEEERIILEKLYHQTDHADLLTRSQIILLSSKGYSVAEIAELTLFDENTILYWFNRYETEKLTGLEDRPLRGHPSKSKWRM